jgi:uncharacterized protein (DUF1015 family)
MPDVPPAPLVTPFPGERYTATEDLGNLLAPPYDVISQERRRQLTKRAGHNIVCLTLPEGDDERYQQASDLLSRWREDKVLRRDAADSVYVVQQEFSTPDGRTHTRTGVIGALAVEPYSHGRVKPHEKTHAEPKADRLALLRSTKAMFEGLLMLARDEGGSLRLYLEGVVSEDPSARAELDGEAIGLWQVTGKRAQDIADAAGAHELYVADGHHRYETAIAYREENPSADRTLGLVVSLGDPGLIVLPTHRLIYGAAMNGEEMVEDLRERFQIHELPAEVNYSDHLAELDNRGTACIVVLPEGNAVALLLKPGAKLGDLPFANQPAVASLGIARIDELVVKRFVAEAGKDARLAYSADSDHVIDEVTRGEAVAGVLLNATSVEQVLAVSDAEAVMPQKATYFMPKVPSGLVILSFEP